MPGALTRFPHFQLLSSNGDGTGTIEMTGDYSVTPMMFYAQAPAGYSYIVTHIHMSIISPTNMNVDDYSSIAGGLTNGMLWQFQKNGIVYNSFGDFVIKKNGDYDAISETSLTNFAGTAQVLQCQFNFPQSFTESVVLSGTDYISITARDNLTTLLGHTCACFGRLE